MACRHAVYLLLSFFLLVGTAGNLFKKIKIQFKNQIINRLPVNDHVCKGVIFGHCNFLSVDISKPLEHLAFIHSSIICHVQEMLNEVNRIGKMFDMKMNAKKTKTVSVQRCNFDQS